MSDVFLKIVNMSISASWIVPIVLILRLLLKKTPKWISVLLWAIVAVRLICPFSFESALSLIPSAETISKTPDAPRPHFESGVTIVDNQVNDYLHSHYFEGVTRPTGYFTDVTTTLAIIWIIGIVILFAYTLISYLKINRKVYTAILLYDNVFQSENVSSPFVLGIIKPKIYLPFSIDKENITHVISHEKAHIKRKDHLWKPLGFLILSLHWFNPIMWLGFILLCRDIELACDEKVIKELNAEQKVDYSQALLNCSVNRRTIAACPIAFGESSVKSRVKSVLNYKKPAIWIIIASVIICAIVALCFLTNPANRFDTNMTAFIEDQIIKHHHGEYKSGEFYCTDFKVLGIEKNNENTTVYMWVLYSEYDNTNNKINDVSGSHILTAITLKSVDSDQYELIEYWEPRDGSYYIEDIKDKFPWYLHGNAFDPQRYITEQRANCDKKAEEYFSTMHSTNNSDEHSDIDIIPAQAFKPVEIVYDDGRYSFVQTVDTAPDYIISDGMQLFEIWNGNISAPIGSFEKISLNKDNFDSRLSFHPDYSWIADETLKSLKDNNKRLWQLYNYSETDISELYILLEQKDGTFYIGYGYYNCKSVAPVNSDDSHIRWLYKLESTTVTDAGGSDEPLNVITSSALDDLKTKFPEYFDLNISKGLKVYIWQMAEDSYSCGLLPNKDTDYTQEELWELHKKPASLDEMRAIVMSYIPEITKDDITILPLQMPYSSYAYTIDETYKEKLTNLFWANFPVIEATSYSYCIDTAVFDIDGDGINEQCILNHGPTSGLFTFTFLVTENGKPEYFNIFHTQYLNLRFEKNESNIMMLLGESEGNTRYMSMHIEEENIVITSDEQDLIYWGEQGVNSPFAPK